MPIFVFLYVQDKYAPEEFLVQLRESLQVKREVQGKLELKPL